MERLNKFLRLPAADQCFLIKAMFLVWMVRGGLWLLPFRAVRRLLSRLAQRSASSSTGGDVPVSRIVWAVTIASQYVPAATCLTQALATKMLLDRHGYRATVRLGVARSEDGQFQAHAWVENDGASVIGGSELLLKHYTPFPSSSEEIL